MSMTLRTHSLAVAARSVLLTRPCQTKDADPKDMRNLCQVRNEEVLLRVNEQRDILYEIRKRKANWISHILRRNCLLQQVIEGKIKGQIEVTRRRGRRREKLLDDLKDRS